MIDADLFEVDFYIFSKYSLNSIYDKVFIRVVHEYYHNHKECTKFLR